MSIFLFTCLDMDACSMPAVELSVDIATHLPELAMTGKAEPGAGRTRI